MATCDLKCRHCKAITRHAVLTGTDWPRLPSLIPHEEGQP